MAHYMLSVFAPSDPGPYGPYASEDEMNAAFAATGEFNDMLQREGFFVFANGLEPVGSATTVDAQGGQPVFTDGPYAQSAAHLGGFWIVDVPDHDTALRLAAEGSKACRGVVEVRPFAAEPDGA